MKRVILIAGAVLLCSAFVNSTGQHHDTVFKPDARIVLGSDLQADSLRMELNEEKARRAASYQKVIVELADGE